MAARRQRNAIIGPLPSAMALLARLAWLSTLALSVAAITLFSAAGTVNWPAAWTGLAELAVLGIGLHLLLFRDDPVLLADRLAPLHLGTQAPCERAGMMIGRVTVLTGLAVLGFDHRWNWSEVPLWCQLIGSGVVAAAALLTLWVFRINTFASAVIKIQGDRDHTVIDSGPYRVVRHPMYGAIALFMLGAPLMFESWVGLLGVPPVIALLAARAASEENLLHRQLPEYADYTTRVPYRLVPFLW